MTRLAPPRWSLTSERAFSKYSGSSRRHRHQVAIPWKRFMLLKTNFAYLELVPLPVMGFETPTVHFILKYIRLIDHWALGVRITLFPIFLADSWCTQFLCTQILYFMHRTQSAQDFLAAFRPSSLSPMTCSNLIWDHWSGPFSWSGCLEPSWSLITMSKEW